MMTTTRKEGGLGGRAVKFPWAKNPHGAGWRAEMPGNVTLFAVPDRTTGLFGERAARGTKWRAGASRWEDSPSGVGGTSSRFGRDVYAETCADAKAAKVLAEAVYREAILEWWRY